MTTTPGDLARALLSRCNPAPLAYGDTIGALVTDGAHDLIPAHAVLAAALALGLEVDHAEGGAELARLPLRAPSSWTYPTAAHALEAARRSGQPIAEDDLRRLVSDACRGVDGRRPAHGLPAMAVREALASGLIAKASRSRFQAATATIIGPADQPNPGAIAAWTEGAITPPPGHSSPRFAPQPRHSPPGGAAFTNSNTTRSRTR